MKTTTDIVARIEAGAKSHLKIVTPRPGDGSADQTGRGRRRGDGLDGGMESLASTAELA
jgi:hypothetical protein